MSIQKNKELCNATEFAAKCGVSLHTILDWVSKGKITPEVAAGGRSYFGESSYAQVQALLLKRKNPVAYLAVLVADDEDELAEKRAAWDKLQKEVLPRGEQITGLKEFLRTLDNAQPVVDDAISKKLRSDLARQASDAFQSSVFERIKNIYNTCEKAMELPTKFFISMILGEDTDEGELNLYNSFSLGSSFSPVRQAESCKEEFRKIMTRYGYFDAIKLRGLSMGDVFRSGVSLLAAENMPIDFNQPAARSLYNTQASQVRGKAKKSFVAQIASKGYFTVIEAVGSLTKEQEDFITNAILDGDYTSIYFSSRNIVSNESLRDIGSAVRVADMKFIVVDEANE